MVPPVKLKLDKREAESLFSYLKNETEGKINRPDVRTELIILAEYYYKTFTKAVKHQMKLDNKPVFYEIPLSVARILHTRIQFYPYQNNLQIILGNIDEQLLNRNMKPVAPKQLSI
ncbi:hypothetical protein Dfri01_39370 [Dyadobacter frigoris]|uniref:hypothetical protein n=1 Tax=Dyadobacter frigoris TaxID=2576211 RepID=UPI0024A28F27|nr:hypothetical protein [Dyadobacter frigoris]GLU54476.1 hypothetical protein Dfri01_39370 [Dyadobacter frigoris]